MNPATIAAADQAHAEAEQTLDKLIGWWSETRADLSLADEVAALTYILVTSDHADYYAALLATAITRLIPPKVRP